MSGTLTALFGWPPGSDEWNRFIEGPATEDMQPLADHLGVETFDVRSSAGLNAIIPKVDHPGVAVFEIPQLKISHMVYVGHVRVLLEQWPYGRDSHPYGYWPSTPDTSGITRSCGSSSSICDSLRGRCRELAATTT